MIGLHLHQDIGRSGSIQYGIIRTTDEPQESGRATARSAAGDRAAVAAESGVEVGYESMLMPHCTQLSVNKPRPWGMAFTTTD